jgi:uncharacterized protein
MRDGHFFMSEPMTEQPLKESPEIRIGWDGVWYFRGMEMTRKDIVQYFYQHLRQDSHGHYQIEIGSQCCRVQVDDVPYIVQSVCPGFAKADARTCMVISLSDGSFEELNPGSIRIGGNNIPYCRVKEGRHEARFSRQAYYQLAVNIEHDPCQDRYVMIVDGCSYTLTVNQET